MIFTFPEIHHKIKTAEELSKQSMQIVTIKTSSSQDIPSGSIAFSELSNITGKLSV